MNENGFINFNFVFDVQIEKSLKLHFNFLLKTASKEKRSLLRKFYCERKIPS